MSASFIFDPPSDEENEFSEHESAPVVALPDSDDNTGSDSENESDEEESQSESESEDERIEPRVSKKKTVSSWDFTKHTESVAEEHSHRSTTSVDDKIYAVRQREADKQVIIIFPYLPDECWEHVFTFLNRQHLESVSVVSKRFLSITNRLRHSLTICKQLCPAIFHTFPNLTYVNFARLCGDRNTVPLNITLLNLRNQAYIPVNSLRAFSQKIKSLRSLDYSYIDSIKVTDLYLIADCFPLLEELNLNSIARFRGNMLNGIENLSLALSKLRKINLSNHTYMNDQSLFHLFNNCKLLEEVILFGCSGITNSGIASALCVGPTLKLRKINLSNHTYLNDQSLFHLFNNCNLLEEVIIFGCFRITNAGIAAALCVRPTLKSISLTNNVDNCTTLLAILRNGPSLTDINMKYIRFRKKNVDSSYSLINFVVSPQLKSLCLARNKWLNDESIIMFASSFPNLQLLDLSYCKRISESICQVLRTSCKIRRLDLNHCSKVKLRGLNFEVPKLEVLNLSHTGVDNESIITFASSFPNLQELDLSHCNQISEGICQLLRTSSKIRHLNLMCCSKVKLHGLNFEIPKLEVLNLSYTTTNDKELYVISKSCRGLLQLLLENCYLVTRSGVDHVVENCTQLREINLRRCYNVDKNIVASMISSRPSLRKIVGPFQ